MKYSQTENEFIVDYTATSQLFVGAWFVAIGIVGIVISKVLIGDSGTMFLVVCVLASIFGVVLMFLTPNIQTRISKLDNTVISRKVTKWKALNTVTTISINEVAKIEVADMRYSATKSETGTIVYMPLTNGQRIKIAAQQKPFNPFDKDKTSREDVVRLANSMAAFLGVPIDHDPHKEHVLDS